MSGDSTVLEHVPSLSRRDITALLERLYRSQRRHHLVAIYGTGAADRVESKACGRFEVIPVRSELELRKVLPPVIGAGEEGGAGEDAARLAFLVPWVGDLPMDIAGRFVRQGYVWRIGRDARLLQLFGVKQMAAEAKRSPLVDYLLRPGNEQRYAVAGGLLTASAMWAVWLKHDWQVPVEGGLALDVLLGWSVVSGRGAQFVQEMAKPEAKGVRTALLDHLEARLGPAGPVVWQAWEEGRGRSCLEHAVVFEALAGGDGESPKDQDASQQAAVRIWLKQRVKNHLGVDDEEKQVATAHDMGRASGRALQYLERLGSSIDVRLLVRDADELVDDSEVRPALARSSRLPSAWQLKLDALGESLKKVVSDRDAESVGEAKARLRGLERHAFFTDPEQRPRLERAEMALRLSAWLVAAPHKKLAKRPAAYAEAEELARYYAEEGGYVDWARRAARGTAGTAFGRGVRAVVKAADTERETMDRAFVSGLQEWYGVSCPSKHLVPIDHVVKRIVARFLDGHEERRLLVLLMDGMAWAQMVEILGSLGERAAPWGPLAWHGTKEGRIGDGFYPSVVAQLPTITEVSRAAFFAGKALKPGSPLTSAKDPERWKSNASVAKYFTGVDVPPLLMRSDGHTKDGKASQEALSKVADSERRVVGIVVNTIDDSLKGNPAEKHRWAVENIASLPTLMEKAAAAGRSVLMVSDHGHVPADRLQGSKQISGGGARWRPWREGENELADHEAAFPMSQVWSPKGSVGVVVCADDAHRYGGGVHAGEHGGATLAEVVAPCVLIGPEEIDEIQLTADPALAARGAYLPAWWSYEARSDAAAEREPEPATTEPVPKRAKKPADERQLDLVSLAGPQEPSAAASVATAAACTVGGKAAAAFAESKMLAAQAPVKTNRKVVVSAVGYLLERKGVASADAFAASMDVLPWRVGGFISLLQEVLNVDGYQVIRYDPQARQIHLDVGKLEQLFQE